VLEADFAKSRHVLETERLVQSDARRVRQGDAADRDVDAARPEDR